MPVIAILLALTALLIPADAAEPISPGRVPLLLACMAISLAAYLRRLRDALAGDREPFALAPYRLLLYCLVAAWIAVLVAAPPLLSRTVAAAAAIALSVYGAITLLVGFVEAPRWLRRLDLVLFQCVFLLLALEIGLRTLAHVRPSVLFLQGVSTTAERIAQSRYPAGTVRFGFPVNDQGHYDYPFVRRHEDERVVLSIGDSFSAGIVPHHYHFTTVAERALPGVQLFNMGLPAIDPPEYLHLLIHEGLALEPDVILINLFAGNDLTYRLPQTSGGRSWSRWLHLDNILTVQVPMRLSLLARLEREQRESLTEAREDAEQKVLTSLAEIRQQFPWVDDSALESPKLDSERFLTIERHRMHALRRQEVEGYHRRLEPLLEMRRVAGDTPIVVMLIPDQFQIDGRLWTAIQPAGASRGDRMRSIWITETWLEANGFPCLNLAPLLRGVGYLPDGRRHLYHLQDTHLNARGNRVAGRALARFLAPWVAGGSGSS